MDAVSRHFHSDSRNDAGFSDLASKSLGGEGPCIEVVRLAAAVAMIIFSVGAAIVVLRHGNCSSGGDERRRLKEREAPGGEEYRLSEDEPGIVYA